MIAYYKKYTLDAHLVSKKENALKNFYPRLYDPLAQRGLAPHSDDWGIALRSQPLRHGWALCHLPLHRGGFAEGKKNPYWRMTVRAFWFVFRFASAEDHFLTVSFDNGTNSYENTVICSEITVFGTPEGIRIPDLPLRRRTLYPAELRGHIIP